MNRPRAVLEVRPDKVARVCAWCPDKDQADAWCESRGYDISHGICPECQKRELEYSKMLAQGRHPLGGSL